MMRLVRYTVALAAGVCCLPANATNAPKSLAVQQAEWCKRLANRLPGISTAACIGTALVPTGTVSRDGFPILARRILPIRSGRDAGPPVRILLLGGIHGDELTASAIVFQWMQWMKTAPGQDFYWSVAPVVNPDGLLAARPKRVNAHGVDLNRNFPTVGWKVDAPRYWAKATRRDPRRYPGPAPLSEPETRWISGEMDRFQPQVIISVHAPFGVLDFDGPAPTPHRFGRLVFSRVGVYPGSLGNYSGVQRNVPVITIELPNARAMPSDAEVHRIWQDMLTWIRRNVPQQTEARGATLQRTAERSGPMLLR